MLPYLFFTWISRRLGPEVNTQLKYALPHAVQAQYRYLATWLNGNNQQPKAAFALQQPTAALVLSQPNILSHSLISPVLESAFFKIICFRISLF